MSELRCKPQLRSPRDEKLHDIYIERKRKKMCVEVAVGQYDGKTTKEGSGRERQAIWQQCKCIKL